MDVLGNSTRDYVAAAKALGPGLQLCFTAAVGSGGGRLQQLGMCDDDLVHLTRREYVLNCNWKVFCDNYLVSCGSACLLQYSTSQMLLIAPLLSAVPSRQLVVYRNDAYDSHQLLVCI